MGLIGPELRDFDLDMEILNTLFGDLIGELGLVLLLGLLDRETDRFFSDFLIDFFRAFGLLDLFLPYVPSVQPSFTIFSMFSLSKSLKILLPIFSML